MSFTVKIRKRFKARQGLPSPIRRAQGLPPLQPADGYDVTLHVAINFNDSQTGEQGWFVDTDSLDGHLGRLCEHLASKPWTELFDFRPTFELVAQWIFRKLEPQIPQLSLVQLTNQTIGIIVEYSIDQAEGEHAKTSS